MLKHRFREVRRRVIEIKCYDEELIFYDRLKQELV